MNPTLNAALSALLLGALTASSVLLAVPQLVRLIRVGHPAGLSGSSLLFGTVNYSAWTVYLTLAHAWGLLLANLVASVVWYVVAGLALRDLRPRRSWWLPAGWAIALVGVAIGVPTLLGPILGLGSLFSYTPQAVRVWRVLSLAAISPTTWVLTAVEGGAWLVQSLRDGLAGGVLSGSIAILSALSVLSALVWRRESAPATAVAGMLPSVAATSRVLEHSATRHNAE